MQNFKEDHTIAFGDKAELHPSGEPDQVDGWYSKKLAYMEWYQLACAKRSHQAQVETSNVAIVSSLIGALKFPLPCIGFGLMYLVGSFLSARTLRKGPTPCKKYCCLTKGALLALQGLAILAAVCLVQEKTCGDECWIKKVFGCKC